MTKLRALICVATAAAAVGALWYVLVKNGPHHTAGSWSNRSAVVRVEENQRQAFSVLRRKSEPAPRYVETSVLSGLRKSRSFHVRSSHLVHTRAENIWIVTGITSGSSLTCLVEVITHSVTCIPTSVATRSGLALGAVRRSKGRDKPVRRFLLIGIVPDWIRSVEVSTLDHARHFLPVTHNSYSTEAFVPVLIERYCRYRQRGCRAVAKIARDKESGRPEKGR